MIPFSTGETQPPRVRESGVSSLDVDLDADDFESDQPELLDPNSAELESLAANKRIALVGRLGSMTHREASNVIQSLGAVVIDLPRKRTIEADSESPLDKSPLDKSPLDKSTAEKNSPDKRTDRPAVDWIVFGADQPPLAINELLSPHWREQAALGKVEILQETDLWQRLGLVDEEQSAKRLFTPTMLAELLNVSVRVIRRWHRRGLIDPVMTLHRLPYFDYAEVATARRLAGWIADGTSPATIEQRLVELVQILPNVSRPLDQLSILVEGKQVLLRLGDGLIEPSGQLRFDFDACEDSSISGEQDGDGNGPPRLAFDDGFDEENHSIIAFRHPDEPPMLCGLAEPEQDNLLVAAYQAEDDDDLETAIEYYHTILARDGPRADISFQIGELLYRLNFLVAARERYQMAIELDPEFVEARASLGAVMAELGQHDLAIAALRGTLSLFDEYADVHYTLAKTLDRVDRADEAIEHWHRIIEIAPDSPWADEARERLGISE